MPLKARDQEDWFVTGRLKNQTGTAEGTSVPPRVLGGLGGFRVPYVQKLQILKTTNFGSGTQVVLSWQDPPPDPNNPVSHYLVHIFPLFGAQGLSTSQVINSTGQDPVLVSASPAIINLQGLKTQRVTLTVQTVLKSGQTSQIQQSPTVTVQINLVSASTSKTFSDSPFTPSDEYLILWDTTGGNCTNELPTASQNAGRTYVIKKTDSTANTVTIDPADSEQIQGTNTFILSAPRETATVYCDGTQWHILSLTIA